MQRFKRSEIGGAGRVFMMIIAALMVIALLAAVGFLLSDINHRRYRLKVVETKAGERMIVQRGMNLPFGFENYVPDAEVLRDAYAPITMPPGQSIGPAEHEVFDDRTDLNRAVFALLAGWARGGYTSDDPNEVEAATEYVARCELLPGLSEQQRIELVTLRADFAFLNGKRLVDQARTLLKEAKSDFELSLRLKTSRQNDAETWARHLEQRLRDLSPEMGASAANEPSVQPRAKLPRPPPSSKPPKDPSIEVQPAPQPQGNAPSGSAPHDDGEREAPATQHKEEPKWEL